MVVIILVALAAAEGVAWAKKIKSRSPNQLRRLLGLPDGQQGASTVVTSCHGGKQMHQCNRVSHVKDKMRVLHQWWRGERVYKRHIITKTSTCSPSPSSKTLPA